MSAPTLAQIWPAKELYESESKKRAEAKEKQVTESEIKYAEITSRDGAKKKESAIAKEKKTKAALEQTTKSLEKSDAAASHNLQSQTSY